MGDKRILIGGGIAIMIIIIIMMALPRSMPIGTSSKRAAPVTGGEDFTEESSSPSLNVAIPANAIPTDSEIAEGIEKVNRRTEALNKLDAAVKVVRAEKRARATAILIQAEQAVSQEPEKPQNTTPQEVTFGKTKKNPILTPDDIKQKKSMGRIIY